MIMDMIQTTQNLYVTTVNLNERSGAGTNYPIVGGYLKDTLVDVESFEGDWAKLKNGYYVSAKYLIKYTDDIAWTCTTTARVNLRNKPNTSDSYVILTVPKGVQLDVEMESNGWLKVTYKGHTGWISGMYAK